MWKLRTFSPARKSARVEHALVTTAKVNLLDYDVRFGQGFLFSPPRPVRQEALQGAVGEADKAGELEVPAFHLAAEWDIFVFGFHPSRRAKSV